MLDTWKEERLVASQAIEALAKQKFEVPKCLIQRDTTRIPPKPIEKKVLRKASFDMSSRKMSSH